MDAFSLIVRPLPQTPPSAGAAPAAKPSASSGKPEDAPAFAPAEEPPQAAANKPAGPKEGKPAGPKEDEPVGPKEANPGTPTGDTPAVTAAPQDQAAIAEQAATAVVNGNALLIAQAAPAATPLIAPVVDAPPPQASTLVRKPDASAAAIDAVSLKSGQPVASSTPEMSSKPVPAAAAPAAATATSATPQPGASPLQVTPETAAAPSPAAPQSEARDGTSTGPGKPNALDALLVAAKPQTTPPPTPQSQTAQPPQEQSGTVSHPAATQPSQPAQVAQLATAGAATNAVVADQPEGETPAPARAPADLPTPSAVPFGSEPGASAHVKTATAAYEAARAATPILPASEQVAMQIHHAIQDGVDKLTVELKPAALGRVSAEIEFHDDHRVHVVLSADRPATLDALRSDSRALERALQDAGLRADAGSLSFRFESGGGQSTFKPDGSADGIALPAASGVRETAPLDLTAYASFARPDGIDIRV